MLRKAGYGLKDAARVWYETMVNSNRNGWKKKQTGPYIICIGEKRENHRYNGNACR